MSRELLVSVDRLGMRTAIAADGKLVSYDFEQTVSLLGTAPDVDAAQVGSVWRARVDKVVPGMHAAFLSIGQPMAPQAFLSAGELVAAGAKVGGRPDVASVVSPGRTVVVQVLREAQGQKGPRVTMSPSFTGAYAVLAPFDARLSGMARSMREQQRTRLKPLIPKLEAAAARVMAEQLEGTGLVPARGFAPGVVLRISAADAEEASIIADVEMLARKWSRIWKAGAQDGKPGLVAEVEGLLEAELKNAMSQGVDAIVTDDEQTRDRLREMLAPMPDLHRPALSYESPTPGVDLFTAHGLGAVEERVLARKASLPSGAWIAIDPTEALTVIDVNAGHGTERRGVGDKQALTVNLESCDEIARQIVARRITGAIVIDFITLRAHRDRKQVQDRLKAALAKLDAQATVGEMSAAGLVEVTRRGSFKTLRSRMAGTCSVCGAEGHALLDDVALTLFERSCMRTLAAYPGIARACVGVSERMFGLLSRPECTVAASLRARLGVEVSFAALTPAQREMVAARAADPMLADLAFEVLSRGSS